MNKFVTRSYNGAVMRLFYRTGTAYPYAAEEQDC